MTISSLSSGASGPTAHWGLSQKEWPQSAEATQSGSTAQIRLETKLGTEGGEGSGRRTDKLRNSDVASDSHYQRHREGMFFAFYSVNLESQGWERKGKPRRFWFYFVYVLNDCWMKYTSCGVNTAIKLTWSTVQRHFYTLIQIFTIMRSVFNWKILSKRL